MPTDKQAGASAPACSHPSPVRVLVDGVPACPSCGAKALDRPPATKALRGPKETK